MTWCNGFLNLQTLNSAGAWRFAKGGLKKFSFPKLPMVELLCSPILLPLYLYHPMMLRMSFSMTFLFRKQASIGNQMGDQSKIEMNMQTENAPHGFSPSSLVLTVFGSVCILFFYNGIQANIHLVAASTMADGGCLYLTPSQSKWS